MPVNDREIIELLCTLAEEEKLRVAFKESLKGGVVTGVSAMAGGILLGPIGLAVGGTLGGCIAYLFSQGKYQPAVQIIATMQPEKRTLLANKVRRIMSSIDVTDIACFAAMVTGDLSVRRRVLETLFDHLRHEMSMTLVDHL